MFLPKKLIRLLLSSNDNKRMQSTDSIETSIETSSKDLVKKKEIICNNTIKQLKNELKNKHFNDSKAFLEYSNDMDDMFKNIEEYNPHKNKKILIVFDDMIADTLSKKKLDLVVTELFIRGRKLNITLIFITQSYFAVPKNIRLNSLHYFIMKTPNKWEL